jgi:hypothetical protein
MTTAHTEKWKVRKKYGGTFVCIEGSPVGVPQEVCRVYNCSLTEARANLIAAAPELFFALSSIIANLPTNRDWLNPDLERIARAVILKAHPNTRKSISP